MGVGRCLQTLQRIRSLLRQQGGKTPVGKAEKAKLQPRSAGRAPRQILMKKACTQPGTGAKERNFKDRPDPQVGGV